jgi:hypothetical protein
MSGSAAIGIVGVDPPAGPHSLVSHARSLSCSQSR